MIKLQQALIASGITITLAVIIWALTVGFTERIDSYARCAEDGNPITETNPPICMYGGHNFIGPRIVPKEPTTPTTQVPFEILVDGDTHGAYPKLQEVITTQSQWSKYWSTVHAPLLPIPPIIPVNFATSNVIAISEGPQMTGGYVFKVTSVSTSSAGTTVNATESIPATTCVVAAVVTDRYFIVQTAKLPPPVTFNITTEQHHCQ